MSYVVLHLIWNLIDCFFKLLYFFSCEFVRLEIIHALNTTLQKVHNFNIMYFKLCSYLAFDKYVNNLWGYCLYAAVVRMLHNKHRHTQDINFFFGYETSLVIQQHILATAINKTVS